MAKINAYEYFVYGGYQQNTGMIRDVLWNYINIDSHNHLFFIVFLLSSYYPKNYHYKIQITRFSKDQPDSRRLERWLTPHAHQPAQARSGAQPAQPTDHTRALSKLLKGTCWTGQCLCSTRISCLSCCWFELFWEYCVRCYNNDQFSYLKSHLFHEFSVKFWEFYIEKNILTGIILCLLKKDDIWSPNFTLKITLYGFFG